MRLLVFRGRQRRERERMQAGVELVLQAPRRPGAGAPPGSCLRTPPTRSRRGNASRRLRDSRHGRDGARIHPRWQAAPARTAPEACCQSRSRPRPSLASLARQIVEHILAECLDGERNLLTATDGAQLHQRVCEAPGCRLHGEYRAPCARDRLNSIAGSASSMSATTTRSGTISPASTPSEIEPTSAPTPPGAARSGRSAAGATAALRTYHRSVRPGRRCRLGRKAAAQDGWQRATDPGRAQRHGRA